MYGGIKVEFFVINSIVKSFCLIFVKYLMSFKSLSFLFWVIFEYLKFFWILSIFLMILELIFCFNFIVLVFGFIKKYIY